MEASRAVVEVDLRPTIEQGDQTLRIIDTIITDIYMPSRGAEGYRTERAITPEPPHVPHRENIAEHSQHLAFTAKVLWDNREALGLIFPADFNINKAIYKAVIHDSPVEVWVGDVNATTKNKEAIRLKAAREMAAMILMRKEYPFLSAIADDWEEYEHKETPEDEYINDLDKIISTRIICIDGGRKWHDWEGAQTTREEMVNCMRGKLRTENGHVLFDAIDRDLDNRPELFPDYRQDTLF
jgi:5'-deoxynucleotidase YfbR-like HD superfamily hydrolase